MAKALFHKNQRVFVKPVGTWAVVERVLPQWVKGLDEPMRVHYDVGLGRDFTATELSSEDALNTSPRSVDDIVEVWRVFRARNRWTSAGDDEHHPFPGTFPVVVTDENDWGGWRVPGAEYDRDPQRIEYQARLIATSPQMLKLLRKMVDYVSENPADCSKEVRDSARTAVLILRQVYDVPTELPETLDEDSEDSAA